MGKTKVAFAGKQGVGKTTAAMFLVESLGYEKFSLATPLKDVVSLLWPDLRPDLWRERIQRTGDALRGVDRYVFVRHLLSRVDGRDKVVVDDVRRRDEVKSLISAGFVVFYLEVSEEERKRRLLERDGFVDEKTFLHISETDLDDFHHEYFFRWDNEGDINRLQKRLRGVLIG